MVKPIKIGVFGATGRVGVEIRDLIGEAQFFQAAVGVSKTRKPTGFILNSKLLDQKCKTAEVFIDFSTPEGFLEILEFCKKNKIPMVSGTTGLKADEKKELLAAAKKIPLLWASNMSLGVAVLRKSLEVLGHLEGFDFQVEEFHHRRKKDQPSGTAITLQEDLERILKTKLPPPVSIRGGGIFGIHRIYAMSEEETLSFEHTALNRRVFARGALKAASWIVNRKPGLYVINDVFEK